MLDPVVDFFTRIFQAIGRGIGLAVSFVLAPFRWRGLVRAARRHRQGRARRCPSSSSFRSTSISSGTRRAGRISTRTTLQRLRTTKTRRGGDSPTGSGGGIVSTTEEAAAAARSRANLPALARRRCHRGLGRFQRQPECVDLVDDPVQARPVRHRPGSGRRSSTTRPLSSAGSIRRSAARPSNSSIRWGACAAPRGSIPICRRPAAICNSTRRPGISA